ncbi:MAG: L-alanine-DL-glutamate epimerase-like enolase superfamily enzyme [Verrucomicrobiales bacterium]|jgi:L-alanine-DL-glutamate epimerase-like enolase superfamily enzyme
MSTTASDRAIRVVDASLYFLPVEMRVPLKFGNQVLTKVICARARVTVEGKDGKTATGWGETPLSVGWVWPAPIEYEERATAMEDFTCSVTRALKNHDAAGHPMEIGDDFIHGRLTELQAEFNADLEGDHQLPHLAALVCFSPLDIAIHDAFGNLHGVPVYQTYNSDYLGKDLSHFLEPADKFVGKFPADFFVEPPQQLPVWHLVGGLDPIAENELTGEEPDDGYPVLLRDWIAQDGLNCLKIKLRGSDADWDYQRLVDIGKIALETDTEWLTTDFNCAVTEPAYVNGILDKLKDEHPRIYQSILYVEQPFPYDMEANRIDVHSCSSRKPLFMDESAHDWKFVRMGRELGWTGVALKTCKTQTGALLSLCWAKAHGMTLMVQDLTNPMLAQVPHALLAAHAGTIMGVESNAMQFYPAASLPEQAVHPGLHQRRGGILDLSTLSGSGFGYRVDEVERELPEAAV